MIEREKKPLPWYSVLRNILIYSYRFLRNPITWMRILIQFARTMHWAQTDEETARRAVTTLKWEAAKFDEQENAFPRHLFFYWAERLEQAVNKYFPPEAEEK